MLAALVLVAIVGQGMGLPRPVKDTPEVAAAKSAHLMALAAAHDRSWRGAGAEDDGSWKEDVAWKHDDGSGKNDGSWKHNEDGSWKDDTRNNGQSWDAQERSWNSAGAEDDASWKHHNDGSWSDDGSWKHYDDGSWKDDTRNEGQSWNAQDRSGNGPEAEDDGSWKDDGSWAGDDGSWTQDASSHHELSHEKKWTGPIALSPGYDKHGAPLPVQDTPEVAAEKSKHIHLHARAASAQA